MAACCEPGCQGPDASSSPSSLGPVISVPTSFCHQSCFTHSSAHPGSTCGPWQVFQGLHSCPQAVCFRHLSSWCTRQHPSILEPRPANPDLREFLLVFLRELEVCARLLWLSVLVMLVPSGLCVELPSEKGFCQTRAIVSSGFPGLRAMVRALAGACAGTAQHGLPPS